MPCWLWVAATAAAAACLSAYISGESNGWPKNGKKKEEEGNLQCVCSKINAPLLWVLGRRVAICRMTEVVVW